MRTILVAIDDSQHSFYALQWALSTLIASNELTQDKIVLVHAKMPAMDSISLSVPDGYMFTAELMERMDNAQDRAIADFINRALQICHEKQMQAETIVQWGDARDLICDTVVKLKADFLVIGSHGYGPIKRAVLGSVSDYCAHHAECPVVVVRKPH